MVHVIHGFWFTVLGDEDPFQVLLDIFGFISLDAILSSINTINCVTRVTPELEYLFLDGGFKDYSPFLPYSWFSKKNGCISNSS